MKNHIGLASIKSECQCAPEIVEPSSSGINTIPTRPYLRWFSSNSRKMSGLIIIISMLGICFYSYTEKNISERAIDESQFSRSDSYPAFMRELQIATGKANHLIESLSENLKADDGATVIVPTAKWKYLKPILKQDYADWVEVARDTKGFAVLPDIEQVEVLSRIKNDIIRAVIAKRRDEKGFTQSPDMGYS